MKALNPPELHPPFAAYSHGVATPELVVTSGQLGITADGTVPDGAEGQARIIFDALDRILCAGGLQRQHVLRLNAYVTDREHAPGYMRVRDDWVRDLDVLPASTLMIVSGFTRPEFVVEVEAIAVRRRP